MDDARAAAVVEAEMLELYAEGVHVARDAG